VLSYQRRISEGHDHARARLRAARASPEWAEIERAHPWRGVLGFFWRLNCLWKDRTPDSIAAQARPPPPPSRTNWTRLVPRPVLTGHVSGLHRGAGPPRAPRPAPGARGRGS